MLFTKNFKSFGVLASIDIIVLVWWLFTEMAMTIETKMPNDFSLNILYQIRITYKPGVRKIESFGEIYF